MAADTKMGPGPTGRTAKLVGDHWQIWGKPVHISDHGTFDPLLCYASTEADARLLVYSVSGRFMIGQQVVKWGGDYQFAGVILAVFAKRSGAIRVAVENNDGLIHIFNESQLTSADGAANPKAGVVPRSDEAAGRAWCEATKNYPRQDAEISSGMTVRGWFFRWSDDHLTLPSVIWCLIDPDDCGTVSYASDSAAYADIGAALRSLAVVLNA